MIICSHCGSSNPDDNNFCDHCGAKLDIAESSNTGSNEYTNNPFESNSSEAYTASSEPLNNDYVRTEHNSNTNEKETSQEPQTSNNNAFIGIAILFGVPGVFVILFIVIYIYISIFIAIFPSNNSTTNTYSETSISETNTSSIAEPPTETTEEASPIIEYDEFSYKELSCEIPNTWICETYDSQERYTFTDPDTSSNSIKFGALDNYASLSNNEVKEGLISISESEYDSYEYEDCTIANHTALKLICEKDGHTLLYYLIDTGETLIALGFEYDNENEDGFMPIIDYVINSCSLPESDETYLSSETTEETTESTTETTTEPTEDTMSDIEYVSIPFYDLITFELPSDWICTDMGDDADWFYFEDPDGLGAWFFIEYCWDFDSCKDYSCTVYLDSIDDGLFSDIEEYNYIYTNIEGYTTAYYSYKTYNDDGVKIWVKGYMINTEDKVVHIRYAFPFDETTTWGPIFKHISESFDVTD